ncbi:MAG: TlpA family protein disulfide reductase [Anaerolineae bacterium]|nr:TlpA family protein disulfide reductase [Anaerolineae bacterium]
MTYRTPFFVVGVLVLAGLVLAGVFSVQSGVTVVAQGQGEPTPLAGPLVPPAAATQASHAVDLAALAEAVHQHNLEGSASTLWAGEMLGLKAPPHIGLSIGDKLPAFGLMTQAGEPFQLDLHGRPLLVNFWASWCPPCVEEFPLLIEADRAGLPYDVVFVSIWDDPYTFAEFLEDYPPDLRVMIDTANTLPGLYDLEFVPISVVIDSEGIIQLIQLGPVNESVVKFAAALLE